jgi:hypothetical protein
MSKAGGDAYESRREKQHDEQGRRYGAKILVQFHKTCLIDRGTGKRDTASYLSWARLFQYWVHS